MKNNILLPQDWRGSHLRDIAASEIDCRAKAALRHLFLEGGAGDQPITVLRIATASEVCSRICEDLPGVSDLPSRREVVLDFFDFHSCLKHGCEICFLDFHSCLRNGCERFRSAIVMCLSMHGPPVCSTLSRCTCGPG